MMDSYATLYGQKDINTYACVTGKTVLRGGIEGYDEASGLATYWCLKKVLESQLMKDTYRWDYQSLDGMTFICQGFGRRGISISKKLISKGAKMIAVMNSTGGLYNQEGINPHHLVEFLENNPDSRL